MKKLYNSRIKIGKNIFEYYTNPKDSKIIKSNLDKALKGQLTISHFNSKYENKTNSYFEIIYNPIKDSKNQIMGISAYVRDLTKHKEIEEQLKIFSDLFEIASDGIIVVDFDGKLVYFNEAAYKQRGYSRKEMEKMKVHQLDAPEYREHFEAQKKKLISQKSVVFETVHIKKDKTRLPVEINARIITSNGEKLILGVIRNITERKKTEKKREELNQQIKERNKELNCLYRLAELIETPQITIPGILKKIPYLISDAYQYPEITCARIKFQGKEYKTSNFKKTQWKQQTRLKVKNQKDGILEVYYLEKKPTIDEGPFYKEERQLINAVEERVSRTIERKQAEKELFESEKRFRTIATNLQDVVLLINTKGAFTYISPSIEKAFGYKPRELLGKKVFKLIHPEDFATVRKNFLLLIEGKEYLLFKFRTKVKSGSYCWLEGSAKTVTGIKGEKVILSVIRNIEERKKMEEKLRQSDLIFENSID
ncbi:MAG: PAS domain S-box protein, partial [Crenarchaeota archaeon]|nr:PAS domain S-box protein [Thermoproteota archaeon]